MIESLRKLSILACVLLLTAIIGSEQVQSAPLVKVEAILQVGAYEHTTILNGVSFSREEFDLYLNSQCELINSQAVRMSVMSRSDIDRLPLIRDLKDPFKWMQESLTVRNPPGSSIIVVQLVSEGDQHEIQTILGSIVKAYLDDIIALENVKRREEQIVLRESISDLKNSLEVKADRQRSLSEEVLKTNAAAGELKVLEVEIDVLEQSFKELQRYDTLLELLIKLPPRVTVLQEPTLFTPLQ